MYADDLVIVSQSASGLQKSLDRVNQYCLKWKLTVNINKTKVLIFNPRLPKGGGYHPQTVCLRLHQNAKQSGPGHLSNLFYILSGHFDEKNPGVTPNMGVG